MGNKPYLLILVAIMLGACGMPKYITVKEVCKKAGVNRSTFYLHYESMDDLLRESVEMINRRFRDAFVNGGAEFDVKGASKEESFLVHF